MSERFVSNLVLSMVVLLCLSTLACSPGEDTDAGAARETDTAADATEGGPPGAPPAWVLESRLMPRGLLSKKDGASHDYILFSQLTSGIAYLIDRDGHAVHTWENEKAGGAHYLLDDGSLLRGARIAEPPNFRAGGVGGYIQRLDWDGNVVWEWKMGDEQRILHHDIEPLPNGNILAIAWEQKTAEEAEAVGRNPSTIPEAGLWPEWILEIEPLPPNDARVVWEWHVWDHLIQDRDPDLPSYGDPAAHPHRLDINVGAPPQLDQEDLEALQALGYIPEDAELEDTRSDFLHMNSIDYHPELDQIVVSIPQLGEIWVLDHSTTTEEARGSTGGRYGRGGDFLYRWGNPSAYRRGAPEDQQLFGQHQALWIPEGQGGAGNLTVFNNGGERAWSSVDEIVPPLDASGAYPVPNEGAWGPAEPLWSYSADPPDEFNAPFISGAVRLANGNTLVCQGPQGRFFEVTPAGEVVWDYRSPYHGNVEGWSPPGTEQLPYAAFRANAVPVDHPGLRGRDLSPLDPPPEEFEAPPLGPPPGAAADAP